MEDTAFRERGRQLRTRQIEGAALTPEEQSELDAFLASVDAEQRAMLELANARIEERNAGLREQAQELRELLERQTALRDRAHAVLDEIEREQASINVRYEALTGRSPAPVA
jgi:dsDNA-specific endonuclease/ATPase MutS2